MVLEKNQIIEEQNETTNINNNNNNNEIIKEISLERLRLYLSPHSNSVLSISDQSHTTTSTSPEKDSKKTFTSLTNDLLGNISDEIPPPPPPPQPPSSESTSDAKKDMYSPEMPCCPQPSPLSSSYKCRQLSRMSYEYSRVKYLLKASLSDYHLQDDIKIWDMRTQQNLNDYEISSRGLLEIESWVSISDKSGNTSISRDNSSTDNQEETSSIMNKSMKFTVGIIPLASNDTAKTKGTKQYLLCRIAIGLSYCIDKEEDAKKPIPAGYNSYYIRKPRMHDSIESSNAMQTDSKYYYEYILNDSRQVLPLYLVEFGYIYIKEICARDCNLCEKNAATIGCKLCQAVLCDNCDVEVHSANKLVGRHKRHQLKMDSIIKSTSESISACHPDEIITELNGLVSDRSYCSKHKDTTVEYYCSSCCAPVCVHCKMVGDHSCGEYSSHRLISITEAYNNVITESKKVEPLLLSRQDLIKNKLEKIKTRIQEIEQNRNLIEKLIHGYMSKALEYLNNEVKAKEDILYSEEHELYREQEQIEWVENYLNFQRSILSPVDFLNLWKLHKNLRADLRDFPYIHQLNAVDRVKADIQLHGSLNIVAGENTNNIFSVCDHTCNNAATKIDNKISGTLCAEDIISHSERKNKLLVPFTETPCSYEEIRNTQSNNTLSTKKYGKDIISPNSRELINKVKDDVAKALTRTSEDKPLLFEEPTLCSVDGRRTISALRGFNTARKGSSPNRNKKINDIWTTSIRSEIGMK